MHVRSAFVPAEEEAEFEENLSETGYVHTLKTDPQQLMPKEYIKEASHQINEKYGPKGYTFIWIEQ